MSPAGDPVVSQSLKKDQAASTEVNTLVCALWWINYMSLRVGTQKNKLVVSMLPIISGKLAIQAKYLTKNQQ